MHFGATLRLLRMESGLGLRDLARRLGVSSAYLSRVENGLDPAPTPARLAGLALELDIPAPLLVDLAHRVSPLLHDYVEAVPEAGTLFLEIAQRRLDARQLAEVRRFLDERFPVASARRQERRGVAELLEPERVIVRLGCLTLDDALDVVSGRFVSRAHDAAAIAEALKRREREVSSAIGGGVAIPCAYLPGPEQAAVVTLAAPLAGSTPDGEPVRVLVVLVGPRQAAARRLRLASIARLAARGLAGALAPLRSPSEVVARIALLEQLH
jgi:PTS system nitrogen regulatory IIA component